MSHINTVLTSMRPNTVYSAEDIAAITNFKLTDVKGYMRMLVNGGLVEDDPPGKYKRNKKYKSKQRALPL